MESLTIPKVTSSLTNDEERDVWTSGCAPWDETTQRPGPDKYIECAAAPEPTLRPLVFVNPQSSAEDAALGRMETKESTMITRQLALAACAVIILGAGSAYAGPCNNRDKDAGSGPTPGATGKSITTGSTDIKEHAPTDTMNQVAGDKAMSAQDAQRQQQGEPTAAQQAQGAKPSPKMADEGC
jgi:hypothetical protein